MGVQLRRLATTRGLRYNVHLPVCILQGIHISVLDSSEDRVGKLPDTSVFFLGLP